MCVCVCVCVCKCLATYITSFISQTCLISNEPKHGETLFQRPYDNFIHDFLLMWVSAIKFLYKTVLLIHEQQKCALHCVTKLMQRTVHAYMGR